MWNIRDDPLSFRRISLKHVPATSGDVEAAEEEAETPAKKFIH